MWWGMAFGAAKGAMEASANIELAKIDQTLRIAIANADRRSRTASNIQSAAQGNLARWAQSVNNNRILESGGKALEVNAINFSRQLDTALNSGVAESIGAAEVAGRAAAASAFAGISGDVVDSVNLSSRLRDRMVRETTQRNFKMAEWDFRQRQSATAQQYVRSLDSSYILDNLDYTQSVVQQQYTPSIGRGAFAGALGASGGADWMGAIKSGLGSAQNAYGEWQTSQTYGTDYGSEQTSMLWEQEKGM